MIAHALAYFTHEYFHSFTAWLLGFKQHPLDLDYGRCNASNILFQQEVDENVQYDPIFASHHGLSAALIAFAGPGIGNGAFYFLYFWLFRKSISKGANRLSQLFFWLALMSAGNVWSYAPTRTITTHGDMALLARGLGISAWALFPLVTVPAMYIAYSFFTRLFPLARQSLFSAEPQHLYMSSALVAYFYFGFFGGSEIGGHYGVVPALFSLFSVLIVLPLAVAYCIQDPRHWDNTREHSSAP
ncbi:hypothetical protein ISP15_01120 [Dyella jejuensis]|uniref:Peptidase M50B-like protein n=1 Tax=Dyella jejuensis TaxID=1432009 RepID=A0ABW8JCX8_9GAMM